MPTRLRPFAASLAFLGLAALYAHGVHGSWSWLEIVLAGLPVLAALGCHARRVEVHVVARAFAWLHVVLGAIGALAFGWAGPAIASALAAAALVALGTDAHESRAADAGFQPIALRGAFLGAITAATAVAMLFTVAAIAMLDSSSSRSPGAYTILLAAGLVSAAACVLRMRALGVLVGLATAALAAGAAGSVVLAGRHDAVPLAIVWTLAAVAGLALAAPVAWSRLRPASPSSAPARRAPIALSPALAIALAGIAAVAALTIETPMFFD